MSLSDPVIHAFESHLDEFTYQDITAHRTRSLPSAGGSVLESRWALIRDRKEIGSAARKLSEHADGALYVAHDELIIYGDDRPAKLSGFGRAILTHAIDRYREAAFQYILMEAYGAGSYLWASCGFEFATGHRATTRDEGACAARRALIRPQVAEALRDLDRKTPAAVAAFRDRIWDERQITAGTFTTPGQIAAFDYQQCGREVAKAALGNTSWMGICVL